MSNDNALRDIAVEMSGLRLYTVYESPRDYPGQYVLRGGTATVYGYMHDAEPLIVSRSLDAVYEHLPKGLVRIAPDPEDDPVILEIWI